MPVDESQPWNAGITAYWLSEGATLTGSKPTFTEVSWRLNKLGALVQTTDELLEDATALESYIMNGAPNAITHKLNEAIISGTGAGKPQGFLSSPFAVTVAIESGPQTADTVVAANILKMYSRMLPTSRGKAAWIINPAVEPQLYAMQDPNGNYIYMAPGGLSASPYGTLMGRPVIPMMSGMSALGDVGDICFVDLSSYHMIKKASGIKSATSIHLLFDKEQTSFRFTMRVDGKCPFRTPVTTQYGSYNMSAIVLLAAR
jgi:HK97 family phage major capsid protein